MSWHQTGIRCKRRLEHRQAEALLLRRKEEAIGEEIKVAQGVVGDRKIIADERSRVLQTRRQRLAQKSAVVFRGRAFGHFRRGDEQQRIAPISRSFLMTSMAKSMFLRTMTRAGSRKTKSRHGISSAKSALRISGVQPNRRAGSTMLGITLGATGSLRWVFDLGGAQVRGRHVGHAPRRLVRIEVPWRLRRIGQRKIGIGRGEIVRPRDHLVLRREVVQRPRQREVVMHREDVVDEGDVDIGQRRVPAPRPTASDIG